MHALELRMPIAEGMTLYKARPSDSVSKLHTYREDFRILMMIQRLFKEERLCPSSAFCSLCSSSAR